VGTYTLIMGGIIIAATALALGLALSGQVQGKPLEWLCWVCGAIIAALPLISGVLAKGH